MDNKKTKVKPRTRPPATSQISQPAVEDSLLHSTLSAFSSSGKFFAFVSLAVDKHCLRVYDTVLGQSVAEHIIDSAKVTSLVWSRLDLSEQQQQTPQPTEDDSGPPLKKKRKKRNSQASDAIPPQKNPADLVLLGLSSGSLLLFSPTHGRILRTFQHPTSTSPILSVVSIDSEDRSSTIWTSCADRVIRIWQAQRNELVGTWKIDDRVPYSSMAVRSRLDLEGEDGRVDLLVANHSIYLLSLTLTTSEIGAFENQKPTKLASFTGHASSVTGLHWDTSQKHPNRFFSTAEGDRFINVWEVPSTQGGSVKEGKLVASIPLDSYVRGMSLSSTPDSSTALSEKQLLLTLSASGKVCVFPVPSELTPPTSTKKTQQKIPTILPRTTVSVSSKRTPPARPAAVSFHHQDVGQILVAAMAGGARPIFEVIKYLDDSGEFRQDLNVVLDDSTVGLAEDSQMVLPNKRYAEHPSIAVQSGVEIGYDEEMDDPPSRGVDGDLDVDLAELSLGQRLTALTGRHDESGRMDRSSESGNESTAQHNTESARTRKAQDLEVPASSLTRTLIQALHSSDSRLLETCLKHSDKTLIRNTVRRLPPQLAEPLINACVERLGRGARAANMKGRGGGASSQRGTSLIAWVRTVLAVHSGHLMTMPDLVARLSALHSTITTRLSLQESLLSLSGRLDMVLSQVEMRTSLAPAPLAPRTGKKMTNESEKKVVQYVEGESEEEERMEVEVEKDSGDEAGSIEDVELGGDSQVEESEEESEEDSAGSDGSDGEEPIVNGFIDDEAEEYTGTDEDEDGEGDEDEEEEEESE